MRVSIIAGPGQRIAVLRRVQGQGDDAVVVVASADELGGRGQSRGSGHGLLPICDGSACGDVPPSLLVLTETVYGGDGGWSPANLGGRGGRDSNCARLRAQRTQFIGAAKDARQGARASSVRHWRNLLPGEARAPRAVAPTSRFRRRQFGVSGLRPAQPGSDCRVETIPHSSNRSRTTSAWFRRSIQGERALRNLYFNSSRPPQTGRTGAQRASSVGRPVSAKVVGEIDRRFFDTQQRLGRRPLGVNHVMTFKLDVEKLQFVAVRAPGRG